MHIKAVDSGLIEGSDLTLKISVIGFGVTYRYAIRKLVR